MSFVLVSTALPLRRRRAVRFTLFALAISASLSCSTSETSSGPGGSSEPEPPLGLSERALRVAIPKHTVPPGDEFECWYTDVQTDREIYVNSATGKQGLGGHHITIYYFTGAPKPAGHHKCIDAEMAEWRQVGAASNDTGANEGVIDLPPGIAVKIPAGKQVVVQTHYINASKNPKEVEDEITVHLIPKEEVKRFANSLAVVDGTFEVPPSSNFTRSSTCTVKRDFELIMLLGHMHEAGKHYKLEHLDPSGKPLETLLDHEWDGAFVSHPPTKRWAAEAPYKLAKGSKLRQTCTWKNTGTEKLMFPLEMCVAFSMYLDDDGFIDCAAQPDENENAQK